MTEHIEIVDVSAEEQAKYFIPVEAVWPELSKAWRRLERKGCTAFRFERNGWAGNCPQDFRIVITGTTN